MKLRDYQIEAIANVYRIFGLHPAGPDDEPIVVKYREIDANGSGDRTGENGDDERAGGNVADWSRYDDFAPF